MRPESWPRTAHSLPAIEPEWGRTKLALPKGRGTRALREARFLLCGLSLLATGACRRPPSAPTSIRIESQIAPQPVRVGAATITISLTGSGGRPLTQARISVEGDMAHPGMSPIFAESKEMAPGRYQAILDLTMAGDWIVLLHVKTAEGKALE